MNLHRLSAILICIFLSTSLFAHGQDMDTALSGLTANIAAQITDHGNKKVTVLDFSDLQGGQSELGKYIAEQLTVDLVMGKHTFAVLDRANLKSILAEHKLTAEGLVDPDNAKKFGQFAGVDALIIGNIVPMNSNIKLTVKIITTDTAEVIGAAMAEFKSDDNVQKLLSQSVSQGSSNVSGSNDDDKPAVVKNFGDLQIKVDSLQFVGQSDLMLTVDFKNRNTQTNITMALSADLFRLGKPINAQLTDPNGVEYESDWRYVTGIELSTSPSEFSGSTMDIEPGNSVSGTIRFYPVGLSRPNSRSPGPFQLQMEVFTFHRDQYGHIVTGAVNNMICKVPLTQ